MYFLLKIRKRWKSLRNTCPHIFVGAIFLSVDIFSLWKLFYLQNMKLYFEKHTNKADIPGPLCYLLMNAVASRSAFKQQNEHEKIKHKNLLTLILFTKQMISTHQTHGRYNQQCHSFRDQKSDHHSNPDKKQHKSKDFTHNLLHSRLFGLVYFMLKYHIWTH